MMKRYVLLMALVTALSLMSDAFAATPPAFRLEGLILETAADGGFLMEETSMGQIRVATNMETVWEGLRSPEAGNYVSVVYSGIMIKSIPPRVTAGKVSLHRLEGTVLAVDEKAGTLLLDTIGTGRVLVHAARMKTALAPGDFAMVYYNGVMAMSDPGQVKGLKAEKLMREQGTLTRAADDHIMLDSLAGPLRVNIKGSTRMPEALRAGDEVIVWYNGVMTRSIPPQISGDVILPDTGPQETDDL